MMAGMSPDRVVVEELWALQPQWLETRGPLSDECLWYVGATLVGIVRKEYRNFSYCLNIVLELD